jgi:hypothetical protein
MNPQNVVEERSLDSNSQPCRCKASPLPGDSGGEGVTAAGSGSMLALALTWPPCALHTSTFGQQPTNFPELKDWTSLALSRGTTGPCKLQCPEETSSGRDTVADCSQPIRSGAQPLCMKLIAPGACRLPLPDLRKNGGPIDLANSRYMALKTQYFAFKRSPLSPHSQHCSNFLIR